MKTSEALKLAVAAATHPGGYISFVCIAADDLAKEEIISKDDSARVQAAIAKDLDEIYLKRTGYKNVWIYSDGTVERDFSSYSLLANDPTSEHKEQWIAELTEKLEAQGD